MQKTVMSKDFDKYMVNKKELLIVKAEIRMANGG